MFEFHFKRLDLFSVIKRKIESCFRCQVRCECLANDRVDKLLSAAHNGVLKYVTCRPPLHAGNRIEDPGGQGSAGDRLGSGASTFLVGDSGFSGACVTQLSATAATAMLREGSGKQRAVTLASRVREKDRLAGREKETESNGRGKSLCASFVLKSIPER